MSHMSPTPKQIKQLQQNCYNIQEWLDHVHGFCQDSINEVYFKLSQDGSGDPMQKWVSAIMDVAMAVTADLDFPGAAITGYAMQGLVGSFSDDTPPSLDKAFGDVWGRFSATFQAMQDSFGDYATTPEANWGKTITDPYTGKTFTVGDLGGPDVFFPSRDPEVEDKRFYNPAAYDEASDKTVAAFKYDLTRNVIGKKWNILHSPKNEFWDGWNDDDARKFAKDQIDSNRDVIVLWWHDQDGGCAGCPNDGISTTEPRLGVGEWYSSWDYYHGENAPKDMCDWLMQDDGNGTVLNPNAITTRHDVFYNWPMEGNLTDHPEGRTGGEAKERLPAPKESRERAREWHRLFSRISRVELEAELVQKAIDDPVFMAELVKDPKAAIEARTGLKIPDEVKIEVVRERPGDYKLVLPYVGRPSRSPS
jgi:hypothetical protein